MGAGFWDIRVPDVNRRYSIIYSIPILFLTHARVPHRIFNFLSIPVSYINKLLKGTTVSEGQNILL